jgi:hypothetical protein
VLAVSFMRAETINMSVPFGGRRLGSGNLSVAVYSHWPYCECDLLVPLGRMV